MKFEICVDTIQSVETAVKAHVDRVELCSALAVGGLTPSYGFLQQAIKHTTVEHHVMIRPRAGNFVFEPSEIEIMLRDIHIAKELGADGVVFGVLTPNGEINIKVCEELIKAADGMEVTFHRAFDVCKNPEATLEQLIELGFTRLLTSGQEKNAWLGREKIAQLIAQSQGRIEIMPGAGVTSANVREIIEQTGAKDIHFSAKMAQTNEVDNGLVQTDLGEALKIKKSLSDVL